MKKKEKTPNPNEDLFEDIVKREIVKVKAAPFEKRELTTIKGKGIRYLKEVTIPHLNNIIRGQKDDIKHYREKIKENRKKVNGRLILAKRKMNFRAYKYYKRRFRLANGSVIKRAKDVYTDKVKVQRMRYANYIDGVSAYPIIMQWCKENDFDSRIFMVFALISHFEWFTYEDARYYGYDTPTVRIYIRKLLAAELVEKVHGKKMAFVMNIKGKEIFSKFQEYYKSRIRKLFIELDKNYQRAGNTHIYVRIKGAGENMKEVSKLNLEEGGDDF